MQELILVRHGESEHHVGDLTGGWTDSALTDLGRRQAELAGQSLSQIEPNGRLQLLSSDLRRATQTADAISRFIRIRPVIRAELRERNNGAARQRQSGTAGR